MPRFLTPIVFIALLVAPALATAQTHVRTNTHPVSTTAAMYAAQMRPVVVQPARPAARALSGAAKIGIGAGIGFGVFAIPVYTFTRDGKLAIAGGLTGAMFGAAIVYKILQ